MSRSKPETITIPAHLVGEAFLRAILLHLRDNPEEDTAGELKKIVASLLETDGAGWALTDVILGARASMPGSRIFDGSHCFDSVLEVSSAEDKAQKYFGVELKLGMRGQANSYVDFSTQNFRRDRVFLTKHKPARFGGSVSAMLANALDPSAAGDFDRTKLKAVKDGRSYPLEKNWLLVVASPKRFKAAPLPIPAPLMEKFFRGVTEPKFASFNDLRKLAAKLKLEIVVEPLKP